MQIDTYTVPSEVSEGSVRVHTTVVIDVLRACSSMLQAFRNGCREIYPVESIERALSLHSTLFTSDILLCGERDGIKINGFHLGNSPYEFTAKAVKDKSLIFTTTNGTLALIRTRVSKQSFICGFPNVGLVADAVSESDFPVKIVCAGRDNHFALEDVVCAGNLISLLQKKCPDIVLTDASRMAVVLYERHKDDLGGMIRTADHGRTLIELGMEKDLDFCVNVNTINVLPRYIEGKIVTQ